MPCTASLSHWGDSSATSGRGTSTASTSSTTSNQITGRGSVRRLWSDPRAVIPPRVCRWIRPVCTSAGLARSNAASRAEQPSEGLRGRRRWIAKVVGIRIREIVPIRHGINLAHGDAAGRRTAPPRAALRRPSGFCASTARIYGYSYTVRHDGRVLRGLTAPTYEPAPG